LLSYSSLVRPHVFSLFLPLHAFFFFFTDAASTALYTLSLHDALPIFGAVRDVLVDRAGEVTPDRAHGRVLRVGRAHHLAPLEDRSEEHTSELQSRESLVCRLLLEKKKKS